MLIGILKSIKEGRIQGGDVVGAIAEIALIAGNQGGTSSALYSIFFSALAQGLATTSPGRQGPILESGWVEALEMALQKLYTYTKARPPSRTLIDPLAAFIKGLPSGFEKAVVAAQHAAEATKDLDAKVGRSAYVDSKRLVEDRVTDPGGEFSPSSHSGSW